MESQNLVTIGQAAKYLGVSIATLRRWDSTGKLPSLKSPGGHRYYQQETLERFKDDLFTLARTWVSSEQPPEISSLYYSDSQDRFRARLESMAILMSKDPATIEAAPLITAIAGEIGNNSFDHNLGNWPDIPGIFFAYDLGKRLVVLGDRGIGIRSTLIRIRPDLKDDAAALNVAMTELVSGRAPEQRGNGLKFVRNVVTDNPIGFSLQSGTAVATIKKQDKPLKITLADRNVRGVLTKIEY